MSNNIMFLHGNILIIINNISTISKNINDKISKVF